MEPRRLEDYASATGAVQRLIDMLPMEIHACIIESLDNEEDVGTIASCALVCRAWLPFCRRKLYCEDSELNLRLRPQWVQFNKKVLQCKSDALAGRLSRVRELSVWPRDQIGEWRRIGWEKGEVRPWAHLVLFQCETRLAGLTYIYMNDVDLSPLHPSAICSGQHYHSLTTLEFIGCKFAGILQLLQLVTSFPALSDLTLKWLTFRSKVTPPRLPKGGHPLTYLMLDLDYDVMAAVVQWLSQAQLVRNLEYLNWEHGRKNIEEDWKTLTNAIDGPSLLGLFSYISQVSQGWVFSLC